MKQIIAVTFLLFFSASNVVAKGGVGSSGGGGGVKPEQRQSLEEQMRLRQNGDVRIVAEAMSGNGTGGGKITQADPVEVKISDLYELTLKDGTVIKADEIKEFFKK
ncbi:putative exported protein [Halobacteriovorax marinus SJ]|uniref:Exported protein n=1 Tax=Halobacteriovorax marinus (strain ATCC BAA-682 / DSM 15412 / SJ) TaxID=862908 RepID=E1X3F2_HALMS|nr:hypothetical protein [Halobacteriovorax marinus]CBW25247.1 putative exported protein [Halobacteriovorax marinus SJ]